jgi:perosamine synthetase
MQDASSILGGVALLYSASHCETSMSDTRTYRVVRAVCVPLVRTLFRPRVDGIEHLPATGGYVLAANQLSNLDGFALAYLARRQIHWMGKAELFVPILAPFLRAMGIFPVRRGGGDLEAVRTAVDLARRGHPVGIFPEGTRRSKGLRKKREARPHTGAARVALTAGVPLIPAAVVGTDRLTTLRRWHVAFGPPVSARGLAEHPRLAAREATARLMDAIGAMETNLRVAQARPPRRLHPRLRLDITTRDLGYALGACLLARRRHRESKVLRAWGGQNGLVCLSVRSAFDLLLQALAPAPDDEVLVSAVTHPDMVRIIEAHGLRPLPVDLDLETLAPRIEAAERALSDRSRIILVAHLFGGRADLEPLAALARRRGMLLVEDCAQAFVGSGAEDPALADVSLFSFGPIKTATALGGCVARVTDPHLRTKMEELQLRYASQTRAAYAGRVFKFAGLLLLGQPRVYAAFARALDVARAELDGVVNGAVRGFTGDELLSAIRRRPSAPLLALLERRLERFDADRLTRRAQAGDRVANMLGSTLFHPGRSAQRRTHWVFPVVAASPASLVSSLRNAGFDAAVATSAIGVVPTPADRPDLEPVEAERMLAGIVFLPAYPELGTDLDRLAALIAPSREGPW